MRKIKMSPQIGLRLSFTLIEMVVVIAIIAILAMLLTSAVTRSRKMASGISCLNNLKQTLTAENFYAETYQGYGPPTYMNSPSKVSWARFLTGGTNNYKINTVFVKLDDNKPAAAQILRCPEIGISPDEEEMRHNYGKLYYDYSDEKSDGSRTDKCADFPEMPVSQWGVKFVSGSSKCAFFRYHKISAPSKFLLFADTIINRDDVNWQFFRFNPHQYVTTRSDGIDRDTGLHLRHQNRVDGVFVDGHAAALDVDNLQRLGVTKAFGAKREKLDLTPTQ
jgi:prepilin-type N-terminal cleavage/methylation domain-containing protein/prepilin-type processing-associated H-X9-DG protein